MDATSVISIIGTVLGAVYAGIRLYQHFRKPVLPQPTVSLEFLGGGYSGGTGEDKRYWIHLTIWLRIANRGPGNVCLTTPQISFLTREGNQILDKVYCSLAQPNRKAVEILPLAQGEMVDVMLQNVGVQVGDATEYEQKREFPARILFHDTYDRCVETSFVLAHENSKA